MIPGRACLVILTAVSHPFLASYPYRKENPTSKQGAGRSRQSYPGDNGRQASKTRTTDGLTPSPIITRPTGFHLTPASRQSPRHTTRTQRDARRDETKQHARRRGNAKRDDKTTTQDARRRDDKATGTASKNETTERDARRQGQNQANKQVAMIGGREERNIPFSNLSPAPPLPPALSNPRAPNYSPAPGRWMSGRVSKLARHRRPSVARLAATSRTLSSHHLIPPCSAAYPHHRRHLSKRAVFGSSFDAHTVIAPPRRTPGKNAIRRRTSWQSSNAPPLDKQDEAKDGTMGWRAVPLVASLIVPRCLVAPVLLVVSVAVPPHIARRCFPSRGGGNSRGGHIFRAVFLSSSYPPRLIASSVPRLSVPSGQASRQSKTAGGHRRFSPPSSYPSPVSSSPRLAPRVGVRGEERLVPVGSVPSSCSCVPASFAVVKAFQSFLGSGPQPSGANKQARAARPPFRPSCRQAGGRRPTPLVSVLVVHQSTRLASKQEGGGSSSRPPASTPFLPLVSVPWLVPGPVG